MKILVIDDDPSTTELMKLILETDSRQVLVANTAHEGIRLALESIPDVVLLDMKMPELGGPGVCREIRKFSSVPIIILSALNDPTMIAKVLDAGADNYLIKPVSSCMLLAHIQNLIQRVAVHAPINA